jgi:Protein of unknown function (DUF3768)
VSDATQIKTARIRELNDQLRCKSVGGRVVITRGIEALGSHAAAKVLAAVAGFDDFTEDNDPWGEHDCAVLTVDGRGSSSRSIITTAISPTTPPTPAIRPSPSG